MPLIGCQDLIRIEPVGKNHVHGVGQANSEVTMFPDDLVSGSQVIDVNVGDVVRPAGQVLDNRHLSYYPRAVQNQVPDLGHDQGRDDRRLVRAQEKVADGGAKRMGSD